MLALARKPMKGFPEMVSVQQKTREPLERTVALARRERERHPGRRPAPGVKPRGQWLEKTLVQARTSPPA